MNMERRDKVRRLYRIQFLFIVSLWGLMILTSCQKDNNEVIAEKFIRTQINCGTYITAAGDEEVLKQVFLEFFTEETYQKYLEDTIGYFYPQLFYVFNADESKINKIKCNKQVKNANGTHTYEYEVSYTLTELDQELKKTVNTVTLKDYLQITMDEQGKITQVIVFNTSDIIKKLFLDVKVQ